MTIQRMPTHLPTHRRGRPNRRAIERLDSPAALLEAIENSLDEMDWLGSDLDFSLLEWRDDEDGLSV